MQHFEQMDESGDGFIDKEEILHFNREHSVDDASSGESKSAE